MVHGDCSAYIQSTRDCGTVGLLSQESSGDASYCCSVCTATSSCAAWAHIGSNTCFFHDASVLSCPTVTENGHDFYVNNAAIAASPPPAASPTCPVINKGVCGESDDDSLGPPLTVASRDECCNACAANAQCNAFRYRDTTCQLKSTLFGCVDGSTGAYFEMTSPPSTPPDPYSYYYYYSQDSPSPPPPSPPASGPVEYTHCDSVCTGDISNGYGCGKAHGYVYCNVDGEGGGCHHAYDPAHDRNLDPLQTQKCLFWGPVQSASSPPSVSPPPSAAPAASPPPPPPVSSSCADAFNGPLANTEVGDEPSGAFRTTLAPVGGSNLAGCCQQCAAADVNCGGFTEFAGTCYFKGGARSSPCTTATSSGRNGYLKLYPQPPSPPAPPHVPPPPPPPPGGTFSICAGPCTIDSSTLPSDTTYNWIIGTGQTLRVVSDFTAGDLFVQGSLVAVDTEDDVTLSASRILVEGDGRFEAGTAAAPYHGPLTILLRTSDNLPASTGLLEAEGGGSGYPTVSIYGTPMGRSWTLLSRHAMPSDTSIVVDHDVSDWNEGDRIVISGWTPNRGPGLLTPGFLTYPTAADNTGLNTFNNNNDMFKNDGHDIPVGERGAIVRAFEGTVADHVVTHCDSLRCCRYDEVTSTWDCTRPPVPDKDLPCKELRQHLPTPLPSDEDGFVCCVLAAKSGSSAATCGDLSAPDCGGVCTWNLVEDGYQWHTAEQARQCAASCVRHTGSGTAEERTITGIEEMPDGKTRLTMDRALANTHPGGYTTFAAPTGTFNMSTAAEVLRLTRNIRITGAGHVSTTALGSNGNELAFRGAATQLTGPGAMNIEGVELDSCGKQTHMGRYCLHFHLAGNCSTCTFAHNSVHNTFQRGITVHGTHYATVMDNAIYDARGANIYMEDGNEWSNYVLDNAATCVGWHHCKISPNTWSNANGLQQDYMEQGGVWGISPSNIYIGNRMSMHENGFFIDSKNPFADGQGLAQNRICANNQPVITIRGNVQHSNTGFGFYLYEVWPERWDTTANGLLNGDSDASCRWFTDAGEDNGQVGFVEDNLDWLNNFVGAYDQGDIAYKGQMSFQNNHGMYWKTTKNFARAPAQAHIEDSLFLDNNLFLGPGGHGTFAFQNTTIRQRTIESNHHCNEGSLGASGSLCVPQYTFDDSHFLLAAGGIADSFPFEYGSPGADSSSQSNKFSSVFILRNSSVYGSTYDELSVLLDPDYYYLTNVDAHQPQLKTYLATRCTTSVAPNYQSRNLLACPQDRIRRLYLWSDDTTTSIQVTMTPAGSSTSFTDTVKINTGNGDSPSARIYEYSTTRPCEYGRDCNRGKSGFSLRVLVGATVTVTGWTRTHAKYPYAVEFSDAYFDDEQITLCIDSECRDIRSDHSRAFISTWGPMVANVGAWPLSTTSAYDEDVADYNQVFSRHSAANACTQAACNTLAAQSSAVSYSAECASDPTLSRCGVVANGIVYTCCRNERDAASSTTVSIVQNQQGRYAFSPAEVSIDPSGTLRIVNTAGNHPLYHDDDGAGFTSGYFVTHLLQPFVGNTYTVRFVRCVLHAEMVLRVNAVSAFVVGMSPTTTPSPPPPPPLPSPPNVSPPDYYYAYDSPSPPPPSVSPSSPSPCGPMTVFDLNSNQCVLDCVALQAATPARRQLFRVPTRA